MARFLAIVGVVLQYWFYSITMVLINKYLLGGAQDRDVSLLVAWLQCVSTSCFLFTLDFIKSRVCHPEVSDHKSLSRKGLMKPMFHILSIAFVGMLSFNNLCLKHVGVAFFMVARSVTLVFTVILSSVMLKDQITFGVVISCLIVITGFLLGVDQESALKSFSLSGLLYGVTSSLCCALVGVYTKLAIQEPHASSTSVVFYNNALASFYFLFPLVFTGQLLVLFDLSLVFVSVVVLSSLFGSLVAWASVLQINYTSPITHHVSNSTKSVLLALIGVFLYNDHKPALWWGGTLLVLVGVLSYATLKSLKVQPPPQPFGEKDKTVSLV